MHLSTEHANAEYVESLTAAVFCTHVDDAFHAKTRADGCSRDAMLAGTGLGDDSGLSNPAGEEDLYDSFRPALILGSGKLSPGQWHY